MCPRPFAWRISGALVYLLLGGVLLYWSFCSLPVVQRDEHFVLHGTLLEPWPQTWIRRGDVRRFTDMNIAGAAEAYWQAVGRNPLLFGGWFALARLERQLGDSARSDTLHDVLLARIPASTSWGWHHMLLAAERGDQERLTQSFNFVLEHLPGHRQEAVEVALAFWGGWGAVFERTEGRNRWAVLEECMARKVVDQALNLYAILKQDSLARPEPFQQMRFVDFLLTNGRWDEAAGAWLRSDLYRGASVDDGGFEASVPNTAFGWRQSLVQGAEIRRESRRDGIGGHAMRISFLGTTNLRFDHFWQYVVLEPGQIHELRFAWKAERLSTDRGPYLEIRGMGCPGLRVASNELTGSRDWETGRVIFDVPDTCRVARIGVRRDESLKFDNKIAGGFWIDDVELVPRSVGP